MSGENYHLIIRKGPKPGQIYPLLAPTITVGRDPMSDISLNDAEVSRYHAQLIQTDGGYQIQDMGSTNGTYVAGQRLSGESVLLTPGQEVAFGSGITLTYELTGGDDDPVATMVDYADAVQPKPETAVPEMSSPPPPPQTSYNPEPVQPLVPGAEDGGKKKRTTRIVIAIILILLLCCCGFIAFMWFYGGDWILRELDLALLAPVVQSLLA